VQVTPWSQTPRPCDMPLFCRLLSRVCLIICYRGFGPVWPSPISCKKRKGSSPITPTLPIYRRSLNDQTRPSRWVHHQKSLLGRVLQLMSSNFVSSFAQKAFCCRLWPFYIVSPVDQPTVLPQCFLQLWPHLIHYRSVSRILGPSQY
jgi:hypothetical protein